MIFGRHRLSVAAAALILLAVVAFYNFRERTEAPLSSVSAKLAGAKVRLEQSLEEQNRGLQHALEAARESLKHATEAAIPTATAEGPKQKKPVGTDGFAYVFYATNDNYACSLLVNIHRLKDVLHTTLAIHVLASEGVSKDMLDAISAAGAVLHMQAVPELPENASLYYEGCLLKLRAFQMHRLSPGLTRVLVLDSDQLVMKNLDHTFANLPEVDLAAPRAYWISNDWISSTFMLISPSDRLWAMMEKAMQRNMFNTLTQTIRYDMDLVNDAFSDTVMMLSGEYVCLNSHFEDWNLPRWYHPERALNWTTIQMINDLANSFVDESIAGTVKRQLFTHTDLAVEQPPTPAPQPAAQQPQAPSFIASALSTPLSPPLPPTQTEPKPRFPLAHPLTLELDRLQDTAAVIHFSAAGKPWQFEGKAVEQRKPDAHPLLAKHFSVWRETAEKVCPGGAAARPEPVPSSDPNVMAMVTETLIIESPLPSPSGFVIPASLLWGA